MVYLGSFSKEEMIGTFKIWEDFIRYGKLNNHLRPVIQASWKRCLKQNVDPYAQKITKIRQPHEVAWIKKHKQELIRIAHPFISTLYEYVKGSGFLIFLADEKGTILILTGDDEPLKYYRRINLMEGAVWSEQEAGTNAIGTAIIEKRPLQIVGTEHYCAIQHGIACSGSPIFGTAGELLGVISMVAHTEKVHPHTLGMVLASARAIENQLKIAKTLEKSMEVNAILKGTLESSPKGIIILNPQGVITQINNRAKYFFKLESEDNLLGQPLNKLLPCMESVCEVVRKGTIESVDLVNGSGRSRIDFNVSIHPFYTTKAKYEGSVLFVEKKEWLIEMTNKHIGLHAEFNFDSIIGESECFMKTKNLACKAASTNSTVLLLGESGTGKELFAQAIHNGSGRKGAFIAVNCSAIPRSLIESELFGYDAGSFTGANKNGRPGKFERAQNGTIFLDEIGDMPLELQAILLRVLQEREIVRVGGYRPIPIDVRVVAATNRKLAERVKEGSFREDLFFRLNVITVNIPSLRERKEDIPLLVEEFLPRISQKLNKDVMSVSQGAIRVLKAYDWPGNVRELENVLEKSILLENDPQLSANNISLNVSKQEIITEENKSDIENNPNVLSLREVERMAIIQALKYKKNIVNAANALGVSRSTLYRKMKEYQIDDKD